MTILNNAYYFKYRILRYLILLIFTFIYTVLKSQSIGIVLENGIDTVRSKYTNTNPFKFCLDQCYQFLNTPTHYIDPLQTVYKDTSVWDFPVGMPHFSTSNTPIVCFSDTSSNFNVTLNDQWTIYSVSPPQTIWGNSKLISKVVKCPPIANFLQDGLQICSDNVIHFSDSSYRKPESWIWTFEGGTPSDWIGKDPPEIKYDNPGKYNVTLRVSNDKGGDTLVKTSTVEVFEGPARLTEIEHIYSGLFGRDTVINSCALGDIYKWIPSEGLSCDDCEQPILTFGAIKKYTCIVSVEKGACSDSCILEIRTETEEPKIFFPNVISPNNDGINDLFEGSWSNAEILELHIYDRWGGVKYSSNTNFTWDGASKGQEVGNGVYVYYVVYKNKFTGQKQVKSGSVTITK